MNKETNIAKNINTKDIQNKISTFRGVQVMIDRDLAKMYGIETRTLKQAVKRNKKRFPEHFMFVLNDNEINIMVSQSVIPSKKHLGGSRPYAFTEQGVAMLSSVLKSKRAIETSIQIIDAFVSMKRFLTNNAQIFQRINRTEIKLIEHDKKINQIFNKFKTKEPKQGIFYEGQIFDAYTFITKIIKKAQKEITLIDNYIDETILTLFTKRKKGVTVTIYTKNITKQLKLDINKFNKQYEPIKIKEFNKSHDRFLIIDEETYHIGASLKDLGKKWFAFSKIEQNTIELLRKIKEEKEN